MGSFLIGLIKLGAKEVTLEAAKAGGKKVVERLFPPKKEPFIKELGKKVAIPVATTVATGFLAVVVDAVKQRARRNSTSESSGTKEERTENSQRPTLGLAEEINES